jgi:hypothetical protein
MMLEELQRRNYSNGTIRHHLRVVEEFARHFATAPDKLGLNALRTYQAYLVKTRKLAVGTVVNHVSALRFFFVRTLKRQEFRDFIPYPNEPERLPTILSLDEVARLIPPPLLLTRPAEGLRSHPPLRFSRQPLAHSSPCDLSCGSRLWRQRRHGRNSTNTGADGLAMSTVRRLLDCGPAPHRCRTVLAAGFF